MRSFTYAVRLQGICCGIVLGTSGYALMPPAANAKDHSFIGPLNAVGTIASTTPTNGDGRRPWTSPFSVRSIIAASTRTSVTPG